MKNNQIHLSQLQNLLDQRIEIVKKVALYKHANNLPALDQKRFESMVEKRAERGQRLGLNKSWIREFYDKLHKISLKIEDEILDDSEAGSSIKVESLELLRQKIDDVDRAILKTCSKMDDLDGVMDYLDKLMQI